MPKEDKVINNDIVTKSVNYLSGDYYRTLTLFIKYWFDPVDEICVVTIDNIAVPEEHVHNELNLREVVGIQAHGPTIEEAVDNIVEVSQFILSDLYEEMMGLGGEWAESEDVEYF